MDSIGAEVGQKMRSAIKAKLMELDCYVDDELPDYIMVMVANRRSKSQMNDDLNLFLSSKTSTFVNWLHIVLKKLKEVTVTNPDVYTKRKNSEIQSEDKSNLKIKKEKSHKKIKRELDLNDEKPVIHGDISQKSLTGDFFAQKSLTDDLPLITNKLIEKRRITLANENNIVEDNFDIPLLSEVNETSNEKELEDIARKINSVKNRLGLLVHSDNEDDWNKVPTKDDNLLANPRRISVLDGQETTKNFSKSSDTNRDVVLQKESFLEKKTQHKRITFDDGHSDVSGTLKSKDSLDKKPSVLDRLGKRSGSPLGSSEQRKRVSLVEYRREEEKYTGSSKRRRSISRDRSHRPSNRTERGRSLSRERSPHKSRGKDFKKEGILGRLGVQSKIAVIKKPEVVKESDEEEEEIIREVPSLIKVKPRVIPSDVPQPNKNLLLKAVAEAQRSIAQTPTVGNNIKPDALFTKKYKEKMVAKDKNDPTPRKIDDKEKSKLKVLIQQSCSRMRSRTQASSDEYDSEGEYIPKPVKNAERCKYWPSCRQGDKCEFVHPTQTCEAFPHCKFREKCLFLHPKCKFGNSCTKRDCPYDHSKSVLSTKITTVASSTLQNCKFFPNCINPTCPFYHPKPCKYGKYCKNISECNFSHSFLVNKKSLSWRSK